VSGRIVAAIAPHAGYVHSGETAGFAFRAIQDGLAATPPDTVVVLGFSHRASFTGVALMDGDALRTPIGEVDLDKDAAALLAGQSDRIYAKYEPHDGEHSAENEVPFIQAALPNAKLVVGIIGDHDEKTVIALVNALNVLARKKSILVVASSDMLHHPDYDLVSRTDRDSLELVAKMDDDAVIRQWQPRKQTFCGIMTVVTAMRFAAAQGVKSATVVRYRNSGDDDPSSRGKFVVGYGSVVFSVAE
jgi:AmmeMemoRadiSam system protein B